MNLAVSNYLLTLLTIKTIFISKTVYLFFVTLVLFVHQSSFLQNLLGLFIVDFRQVILKVVFLVILLDFDVLRSWVHAWDHRSQLSLEKDEMFHVAGNLISNRPFLYRKLKKSLLIIRSVIEHVLLLRKNKIKQGHWKPRHQTATKKLDTKIRQKNENFFSIRSIYLQYVSKSNISNFRIMSKWKCPQTQSCFYLFSFSKWLNKLLNKMYFQAFELTLTKFLSLCDMKYHNSTP